MASFATVQSKFSSALLGFQYLQDASKPISAPGDATVDRLAQQVRSGSCVFFPCRESAGPLSEVHFVAAIKGGT
jgi:hypothetical protein